MNSCGVGMDACRAGVPWSLQGASSELAPLVGSGGGRGVCIHVQVCVNHMACEGANGRGISLLGII